MSYVSLRMYYLWLMRFKQDLVEASSQYLVLSQTNRFSVSLIQVHMVLLLAGILLPVQYRWRHLMLLSMKNYQNVLKSLVIMLEVNSQKLIVRILKSFAEKDYSLVLS